MPELSYPTLTKTFPDVDFASLDRLYIPAGRYRTIQLGGLPTRTPERPLVITNLGGQVKVGGDAANFVFVINGGSNWVLTGRYDPLSKTGDSAFRGHADGAYAHSQGSYGIVSPEDPKADVTPIHAIVEKPAPAEAPSTLAVVGRYVLTPAIFELLSKAKPGRGGEIQLTDAIAGLLARERVLAMGIGGKRYDCGSKLGYLQATVELGLRHPSIGKPFAAYLDQRKR